MDNQWIVWIEQLSSAPVDLVGGKAKGLGQLYDLQLRVPTGFCITTNAIQKFSSYYGLLDRLPNVRDTSQETSLKQLSAFFTSEILRNIFPHPLETVILQALNKLLQRAPESMLLGVAVRSSFVSEDTAEATSAGQYDSYLGVVGISETLDAIKRVWASAFSPKALSYRATKGLPVVNLGMAVVIQAVVETIRGGIVYTMRPETQDPSVLIIEAALGHPSRVADSQTMPNRYIVSKRDTSRIAKEVIDRDGALESSVIELLVGSTLQLERKLNAPLDIEWCLPSTGALTFLQVRKLAYTRHISRHEYVVEAYRANLQSGKIKPFRLQAEAGLSPIQAHVVTPCAFAEYRAHGFSESLTRELGELYAEYCQNGDVSIRSSYWSAINRSDMLPQSPRMATVDACLEFTKHFWEYIIHQGFDDYSAEVSFMVGNWLPVFATAIAVLSTTGGRDLVVIGALYGFPEGLEANAHDVYEVDPANGKVLLESVPRKDLAVLAPGSKPTPVPLQLVNNRVLPENLIADIARRVKQLSTKWGQIRVEILIVDTPKQPGNLGVVVWQIDTIATEPEQSVCYTYYSVIPEAALGEQGAICRGRAVLLRDPEDMSKIQASEHLSEIVLVDLSRAEMRDVALATQIGMRLRDAGLPIALKGSILSHFAATLRDYGLVVYPVNTLPDIVEGGEIVCIAGQCN